MVFAYQTLINYDIKILHKLYIESVAESSPKTDLDTYIILVYNITNATNQLAIDGGANTNRISKTLYTSHYTQNQFQIDFKKS